MELTKRAPLSLSLSLSLSFPTLFNGCCCCCCSSYCSKVQKAKPFELLPQSRLANLLRFSPLYFFMSHFIIWLRRESLKKLLQQVIIVKCVDWYNYRYLGVFMLVFGFVSLIIGLIFCAWMCREGSPDAPLPPNSELYWTHHWYAS